MANQDILPYEVYAGMVSEVELDSLTGRYLVKRIDLLYDAGLRSVC